MTFLPGNVGAGIITQADISSNKQPLYSFPLIVCLVFAGLITDSFCRGEIASLESSRLPFPVARIEFGRLDPPVVAQSDITVSAATSNQQSAEAPLECSGMIWLEGCLVITSDRHQHSLFVCPVDLATLDIGRPVSHVIIRNEQDLLDDAESITLKSRPDGSASIYVMCSLSNNPAALPLPMRQHILRMEVKGSSPGSFSNMTILNGGIIRNAADEHFLAVNVQPYRTWYPDFSGSDKNTYRWANLEGLCFVPNSTLTLLGFRNPLLEEKALVAVVDGFEKAFDTQDPKRLSVQDLFTLDLGARGISDLAWDPVTRGYLIAAARSNGPWLDKNQPFPPNELDEALFWWSGQKSDKPILFARVLDMKIEAVCRLGSSRFIAIGSDEGDVSESRTQRQSILTILDFPGPALTQR